MFRTRASPSITSRKRLLELAVVAAMALSSAACGWRDGADGSRSNEPGASASAPDVLAPLTGDQPTHDLFVVETDHAEYWRMFTMDRYDGESWTSSNPDGSKGGVHLSAPATLPRSDDGPRIGAETLDQTFHVLSGFDVRHALPMAQTAEEIAGPIGDITWDPTRSQAFIDGRLEAGMTYTVRSSIVVPTPEQLDRVDFPSPRAYGEWTELPADLDPRIQRIAERWTAVATSEYRKVLAIQQRFQEGDFAYSTDVEPADDADALIEFLTRTKTGFCMHYSSAMAVMVRTLGLPARIGVGYRSGIEQQEGSYLVNSGDAHVWVEVLFPGYGWLQFEPEAGAAHPNAQPGTYLNPVGPMDAS